MTKKTTGMTWALVMTLAGLGGAATARAEELGVERDGTPPVSWREVADQSARQGAYLPATITPTVSSRAALVTAIGGYDGARQSGVMESVAEVRVWGPLAVRGGAVFSDTKNRLRPSVGARFQFLHQKGDGSGADAAVGVFYRPEGLTEPEGEIETVLSVGRSFGAATLVGNLAYGQDPEGNERDGEVRVGALYRFGTRVYGGFDSRARFDLGSQSAKLVAANEPTFDLVAGPTASVMVGPMAVTALAGVSTLKRAGTGGATETGALVLAGLGTAF